jgi:macrolide transport system ATP-binding/permease protein
MAFVSRFFRELRLLIGREKFRDELNEEMEFHRAAAERALVDEGMRAEDARFAARRQFGNATRLNEQSHEVVSFGIETVVQDLRFAIRQLRKSPGFSGTAVLVLALGIAASVSIFAFVDAALLRPLPYQEPGRLVNLFERIRSVRDSIFRISTISTGRGSTRSSGRWMFMRPMATSSRLRRALNG